MHDLVRNRGSTIRGGRTNIEVLLEYNPPGGKAGELVAELVKDPDSKSGGRSTASARQWSAAASSAADRLARTCGPARVGGHRPSQPRHYEQSDS
jgi:hypothetical protein